MVTISQGQGRSISNSWTRCALHLKMPLPSLVENIRIDLEKSAKMHFQTLKMATISQGQGHLRSNFCLKWLPFRRILSNQAKISSSAKYHRDLCKIEGTSQVRHKDSTTPFGSCGDGFNTIKNIQVPHFMWDLIISFTKTSSHPYGYTHNILFIIPYQGIHKRGCNRHVPLLKQAGPSS